RLLDYKHPARGARRRPARVRGVLRAARAADLPGVLRLPRAADRRAAARPGARVQPRPRAAAVAPGVVLELSLQLLDSAAAADGHRPVWERTHLVPRRRGA